MRSSVDPPTSSWRWAFTLSIIPWAQKVISTGSFLFLLFSSLKIWVSKNAHYFSQFIFLFFLLVLRVERNILNSALLPWHLHAFPLYLKVCVMKLCSLLCSVLSESFVRTNLFFNFVAHWGKGTLWYDLTCCLYQGLVFTLDYKWEEVDLEWDLNFVFLIPF